MDYKAGGRASSREGKQGGGQAGGKASSGEGKQGKLWCSRVWGPQHHLVVRALGSKLPGCLTLT